ncbi:MAG: hypothetical protein V7K97_15730 [Nostoc sp.]|uniref:hypothetical protein n=1 Tax=Nostoc sp. TaxID=1180 RepID=UPI002FFAE02D
MAQISCPNCGKQKNQKIRICPHCKNEFFPCRRCKTLLLINEYRFIEVVKASNINEIYEPRFDDIGRLEENYRYVIDHGESFIRDRACPNCGNQKPLKRFGNTFIGGIIIFIVKKLLMGLFLLIPATLLLCIEASDLLRSITHLSINNHWIPYWSDKQTFLGGVMLFVILLFFTQIFIFGALNIIFPDVCGVNPELGVRITWDMNQYRIKRGKELL